MCQINSVSIVRSGGKQTKLTELQIGSLTIKRNSRFVKSGDTPCVQYINGKKVPQQSLPVSLHTEKVSQVIMSVQNAPVEPGLVAASRHIKHLLIARLHIAIKCRAQQKQKKRADDEVCDPRNT
jgi:hypothetical protein